MKRFFKNLISGKKLRCTIVTIAILLILGFIPIMTYGYYFERFGRYSYADEYLSDNVVARAFKDNTYRIYNTKTKKYTTSKIEWVSYSHANDSLAVYAISGKRGYINVNTGEIVINAENNNYSKAWVFSEGLAAVMKDGKIGFINSENKLVIPFKFDYPQGFNIGYVFNDGYCIMTNAKGESGFIDKNGNWVIDAQYDQIWTPQEKGYRIVVKDNKQGLLDSSLNLIYDTSYEYIELHSEDGGFILAKDGKMWQEDFSGNIVQSFMFEDSEILTYSVGQERVEEEYDSEYEYINKLSDFSKYSIAGKYGIMNRITGEVITLAIYEKIVMISSELFEVKPSENYARYVINTKGKVIKQKN